MFLRSRNEDKKQLRFSASQYQLDFRKNPKRCELSCLLRLPGIGPKQTTIGRWTLSILKTSVASRHLFLAAITKHLKVTSKQESRDRHCFVRCRRRLPRKRPRHFANATF